MENREVTVFFGETTAEGQKALLEAVRALGGRHIKTIGSACLCLFDSPQAACNAAHKLLRTEPVVPLRIGIAKGTATLTRDDAFGEVVNLAARLQGIARPQEVYFSDTVLIEIDRARIPFKELGTRQFKGIERVVHVYSLLKTHEQAALKAETSPAVPKELFDFSHVDQERIQEQEALRGSMAVHLPEEDRLALARKPEAKPSNIARPRASQPRTNPEAILEAKRKEQRKSAVKALLLFAIAIPALSFAAMWGYSQWNKPRPQAPDTSEAVKAKGSELVSTMAKAKTERIRPKIGSLLIETEPDGALVYFNNRLVSDRTPAHLKNIPAGTPVQLKVTKFGFKESVQFLNIAPDERRELKIRLEKKK
jgi:hypothetical protein